ncbi:MAG: hypothetical protein AAB401_15110, partial [Acidobacteriota bacterium]
MKNLARLLKTKLCLFSMLCLIAATAVYFLIPNVSADSKRSSKTSGKVAKRKTVAKRTQPTAQQPQSPAIGIGGAAMQSDALTDLLSFNPMQDFWDQWGNEKSKSSARKREVKRADEPDKAIQYFLKKRLPEDETELPVEKYFEAMEAMRQMNVFSTADDRFVTREELHAAPEQPKLGTWTSLGPGNIGGRT